MKSEIIKSRLDLIKYVLAVAFSLFLILTNLVGISNNILTISDTLTNPIIKNIHNFGVNTNIFFTELSNKNGVLEENINLKTQISDLESIKAENEALKQKIVDYENKYSIQEAKSKNFKLFPVRGVQDVYSSSPSVYITLDLASDYRVGQVVYYNKNQIFGFVTEITGLTAKVVPFYSPELDFRIPVQSSTDPTLTGFIVAINQGEVHITNVNKDSSINKGDIWVTTNDRANIPGSLVIGKIKDIYEDKENGFKDLTIESPFDVLSLENLLIVPNE